MRTKQLETNPDCVRMEIRERVNAYLLAKYDKNVIINKYTHVQHREEYDIIFSSANTICEEYAEIKTRNYYSTTFKDYILEKRKYDSLMEYGLDDFIYINFFNDVMIGWRLHREEEYNWVKKRFKKYTCRDSAYEDKMCLMLKKEDALFVEKLNFKIEEAEKITNDKFNKDYSHLLNNKKWK